MKRIRYGGCKGNRIFNSSPKGKAILAVLMAAGTLSFPVCGQAAFTGEPGTYGDFVTYKGSLSHSGTSEYTFEKGALFDGSDQREAFSVNNSSQDMTIHVGKADGNPYDFEAAGYTRSFMNIDSGKLTIDDQINGQSTGADYHFYNNADSRREAYNQIETLFFTNNSETSISGHSVTIDSINNKQSKDNPDALNYGILSMDAKSVSLNMTGDFNLDNELMGIYVNPQTRNENSEVMDIQAKNIHITCNKPNENLAQYSWGVTASGDGHTAKITMKATDDLSISGYTTAVYGWKYVDMSLSGKNVSLVTSKSSDGESLPCVLLQGRSKEDSKLSLAAEDTLNIAGVNGDGLDNRAGTVNATASNITVSSSESALNTWRNGITSMTADRADYKGDIVSYNNGTINLNATNNLISGEVLSLDGGTISIDGKNQDGSGTVQILNAGAPAILAGVYHVQDANGNYYGLANVDVKQNAVINVHEDAKDTSYQDKDYGNLSASALAALSNGKITLDKAQGIYGNITADIDTDIDETQAAEMPAGTIDLTTAQGGEVKGNISANRGGTARVTLKNGTWEGRGTDYQDTGTAGTLDLTMEDGSVWHMKGDSWLTSLSNTSSLVDMKADDSWQTLHIGTFQGQDGTFLLKTDLDSQQDGDKVYIDQAEEGSRGQVQVYDASFLKGKEVTGARNLLLITDASKNAVFTGRSLDKGGLWDVTPTIQRGDTVKDAQGNSVGTPEEWYLTKVEKKVNRDTVPLVRAADIEYGLYRDSLDTLRQRMGDLRVLKKKGEAAGLWARMRNGEFSGPDSLNARYHSFQLGYDEAVNPKSVYGVLAERGIASPAYAYGKGKDHTLAGALYGTWFGDNGSYTDVVARYNRDDAHVSTYGGYPDRADWRSHDLSASVEYGRTIPVSDKGYFVEPQTQFQVGHLGSYSYTTLRGKKVYAGGYDSAVGRIGFAAGRRGGEAGHPYDWYVKASLLHEFGGDRALHLAAPDGETLDERLDHQGTWYTLGLGGSLRTGNRTYLYGDMERSFGGSLQKKWQWNIGMNWQF